MTVRRANLVVLATACVGAGDPPGPTVTAPAGEADGDVPPAGDDGPPVAPCRPDGPVPGELPTADALPAVCAIACGNLAFYCPELRDGLGTPCDHACMAAGPARLPALMCIATRVHPGPSQCQEYADCLALGGDV